MSSGGGVSRVSIPGNIRKIIQNIREITGKQHSDDDIYAVLKECSMDPNETAHKLLHLDTFHEVKHKKRDRRKENVNGKIPEDSRMTPGTQGRMPRDAIGGRNVAAQRDKAINYMSERGSMHFPHSASQKTKNTAAPHGAKVSTVTTNGPVTLSNGGSTAGSASQSNGPRSSSFGDMHQTPVHSSQPDSDAASSGSVGLVQKKSEPSSVQVSDSVIPESVTSNSLSAYPVASVPQEPGAIKFVVENHTEGTEYVYGQEIKNEANDVESLANNKGTLEHVTCNHQETIPIKPIADEKNQPFASSSFSWLSSNGDSLTLMTSADDRQGLQKSVGLSKDIGTEVAELSAKASSLELNASNGQHVTFPSHFKVPETLTNGLTFGSFEVDVGLRVDSFVGSDGEKSSENAVEASQESETSKELSSSIETPSLTVQGDVSDNPHALGLDDNTSSSEELKNEQPQIPSSSEGIHQNTYILDTSNNKLGSISPTPGSQPVQFEGPDNQISSSLLQTLVSGNPPPPPPLSSPTPTPPLQLLPPPLPVYRQPYPPNFFPYGPYFSPFYMPQIHPLLSQNGALQQPSTGNVFISPAAAAAAAAAAGFKYSLPHFKQGANVGNAAHIGIASGGSFIAAPVCYPPGPAVTSGSSACNDDLAATPMKENHIYTTGQLSEGSAVWISGPGQDISNLQVGSLYNLPPQGQHVMFPSAQAAGHGAFAGIYKPLPTIATPSPLLQQSQALGISEIGPPSGVYQQPQHVQINWNTNF